MISKVVEESKVKALRGLIEQSENIVLTCHVSPDGDAIGSCLAMYHVLSSLGKDVKVLTPDMPPKNMMFLCFFRYCSQLFCR